MSGAKRVANRPSLTSWLEVLSWAQPVHDSWSRCNAFKQMYTYRCMSATRTQIYFSEQQRQRIDRAAAAKGITMAELVREAVDEYLADEFDASEVLAATFGAAPDMAAPSREEWRRG